MNLPIIPTIKSVTDLRYQTADIIKLLEQNQPVVVTRDNDTIAVILSPTQYQQIIHLFEELEEEKAVQRLEKAIKKGGKFIDFDLFDNKQRKK
ncbi:MAG: type II toxin-antitoxin system Phd/YefM family antitoxin [Candidatus Blackburnbacteria bacterium]|nr:type II toxin-antitoxin system Phd/YefM family antitoxin [Candidatus Blackburnbacteria bacterium]